MSTSQDPWEDNELQFARLLCELIANNYDFADTCRSMDLEEEDLHDLFERAHLVWEKAKQNLRVEELQRRGQFDPPHRA